jgi:dCMP deaminase
MTPSPKDLKYLELASQFARSFSKDRSTQVGAMFLHETEYTILTAGYNGMPRGCNDDLAHRHERPLKYQWFEHAERNAIYNAVRDQLRGSVAVCPDPLDVDDIRAIVSVGAKFLAAGSLPEEETAQALLAEAGVTLIPLDLDLPAKTALFHAPGAPDQVLAHSLGAPKVDESAVRSAIFNVARGLLAGSTLVVGPLPPCAQCAKAVAAVGARRVVTYAPTAEQNARWGASFDDTRRIFARWGVSMAET